MRIAVFGTGGVGGYFGGRLALSGEQVVFIARGEGLQALRSNGLRVDSVLGDFRVEHVEATHDPAKAGVVDAVLVGVKAWQVPEAALAMQPLVGEDTCVLPLQNGVDAPAQLAAVLGARHVLGGLCRIACYRAGPGHIIHTGITPYVALGEMDSRSSDRVERLRQAFAHAGVTVEVPPDIQVAMWEKFIFIAAISGVGAVTRAPVDVFRKVPETRRLLESAIQEVEMVARSRKVMLREDIVARTLAVIDGLPEGTLASMQRDVMEGRPSELGSQNGAVLRMGLEMGVSTPAHEFIYQTLLPSELKARGELSYG
jgi:2-dehydropantoate 2-reductase